MTARRALPLALVAVAALVAAPTARAQQAARECTVAFEPRTPGDSTPLTIQVQPSGQRNIYQGGGVRYRCVGQDVVIEADSAAYYGDLATLYMVGNVHYVDEGTTLDAMQLTYYRAEEWLVAQGDVRAQMEDGSTLRGPTVEYFRAVPGVRPLQRVVAPGRPTLTLQPRDSAGQSQDPVDVTADRIVTEGDSLVYAGGRVVITRPDLVARADSAVVDEGRQFARLLREPEIEARGERPFTLRGSVIDLFSTERELERVLSSGSARVISEDVDVAADTLDLRVEGRELERAFAWGPSRARATSPGRDIIADSLDVRVPGGRLREVFAIGGARVEGVPDTLRIRTDEREWLTADTIVARFDSTLVEGDTSGTPPLEWLRAEGGARSFQLIAPDTGTVTTRPSIHYVEGRVITVTFAEGELQRVDVVASDSGVVTGVFLDATGQSAGRVAGDSAARADAAPRPAPTVPPAPQPTTPRPATPPPAVTPPLTREPGA
jgi:lipopolysaccharide export system protein LptA